MKRAETDQWKTISPLDDRHSSKPERSLYEAYRVKWLVAHDDPYLDSGVHHPIEGRAYRGEFRRVTPPRVMTPPRWRS
jgi:hypothetical protein